MNYRSYKNFNIEIFKEELRAQLSNLDQKNMTYEEFRNTFLEFLNASRQPVVNRKKERAKTIVALDFINSTSC